MKLLAHLETADSLAETIERFVHLRTDGQIQGLQVEIDGGEVIISGRTETYYAKQLATHAVLGAVKDAKEITLINDIEVC